MPRQPVGLLERQGIHQPLTLDIVSCVVAVVTAAVHGARVATVLSFIVGAAKALVVAVIHIVAVAVDVTEIAFVVCSSSCCHCCCGQPVTCKSQTYSKSANHGMIKLTWDGIVFFETAPEP